MTSINKKKQDLKNHRLIDINKNRFHFSYFYQTVYCTFDKLYNICAILVY